MHVPDFDAHFYLDRASQEGCRHYCCYLGAADEGCCQYRVAAVGRPHRLVELVRCTRKRERLRAGNRHGEIWAAHRRSCWRNGDVWRRGLRWGTRGSGHTAAKLPHYQTSRLPRMILERNIEPPQESRCAAWRTWCVAMFIGDTVHLVRNQPGEVFKAATPAVIWLPRRMA